MEKAYTGYAIVALVVVLAAFGVASCGKPPSTPPPPGPDPLLDFTVLGGKGVTIEGHLTPDFSVTVEEAKRRLTIAAALIERL